MSYKRRAADRQRALKARHGTGTGTKSPRTYHRETPIHGHVESDRKLREKRGYIKHKGNYDD